MKIIVNLNWTILGLGILLLTYVLISKKTFGNDPAGQGLANAYSLLGLIILVVLLLANCLPFNWVRITVFVLLCLPIVGMLPQLVLRLSSAVNEAKREQKRFDGRYYFADRDRQNLANAIAIQDVEQVRSLLQLPIPNLSAPGTDHVSVLDYAAMLAITHPDEAVSIAILSALMDQGATIETTDAHHIPTHVRIGRGCTPTLLEWFLKKGANPNARDPENEYAPMLFSTMAAYRGSATEKVQLLLAYGADPNGLYPAQARSWLAGHTVLQAAARQSLWEVCRVLLEKGADPRREGPQHFVFTEYVVHQANLHAQMGTQNESFTTMQQTLQHVLAHTSSKK
ncbi:ankyrin repeat domain-containing protein [Spirosoma aerolatum]|uniref:ankyrin repeat domain-containing protein n=1 Tax=Spirosoma aerolatum TaxID=1211326 RepID=UPI0009AC25B6|nr:ankyrin repeat domain-containing protein [Spirosoma aerolatum]